VKVGPWTNSNVLDASWFPLARVRASCAAISLGKSKGPTMLPARNEPSSSKNGEHARRFPPVPMSAHAADHAG